MQTVSTQEAWDAFEWCRKEGLRFVFGKDPRTELTVDQVILPTIFPFKCGKLGVRAI